MTYALRSAADAIDRIEGMRHCIGGAQFSACIGRLKVKILRHSSPLTVIENDTQNASEFAQRFRSDSTKFLFHGGNVGK